MNKSKLFYKFYLLSVLTISILILVFAFPNNQVLAYELTNGDLFPETDVYQCLEDQFGGDANCTANDVRVRYIKIVELYERCDQGVIGELEADVEIVLEISQPDRYDIGFFIATDGGSAQLDYIEAGGSNSCYHGYLGNFWKLTSTPLYGDHYPDGIMDIWDLDTNPATFNGFYSSGVDTCGDMIQEVTGTPTQAIRTIKNLRIACESNDGDPTTIDFDVCTSWKNNEKNDCSDIYDAVPETPSKCYCETIDLYAPNDVTMISLNTQSSTSFGWLVPTIAAVLFIGSVGVVLVVKKITR